MVKRSQQSRVANVDERDVLRDDHFQRALEDYAADNALDLKEVEKEAHACLDELSVRPADRYLRWVSVLARFMVTRSFDETFDVNRDAIDNLKELAKTRPLVFLWSHKSHLDSFVFMKALYDADFRPQPLSFAGINMAFIGFGALARNSGAVFLRRSFKDDEIYKLVLRHFIDYLVARRVPLSWSIEGTRSRTGKLMPPKLGLIQWVVDSWQRASCDDALLVPVAISFDQIPEIDDYIAMQRGLPKRKESLRWFIDYIAGMKAKFGKIYVRFAEPVALSTSAHVADAMLAADADRARVQKLAFEVCSRIEHAKPINATDLVTLVLLAANNRSLDTDQIAAQSGAIVDLVEERRLPQAGDLRTATGQGLQEKLDSLTETGLLECFEKGAAPVYSIASGRQLAAAYYRNTIVHYFVANAIAEVALAAAGQEATEEAVLDAAMRLRDLLKFEFFFKTKAEFRADVSACLNIATPATPLFGPGILRSLVEAYRILAQLLVSRDGLGIDPGDEHALVGGCLERGEEMLRRQEISTEAALAQPLFETALRLARHRHLLEGDAESLIARRRAFAEELERVQAAIDRLQDDYDRGTVDTLQCPEVPQRSIA